MTVPSSEGPDLSKIEAAPIEKIVTHFNNFVINTTHHLNKFIATCDKKLADVSSRIYRIEATLANLEKKLASIPDSTLSAPPPSAQPPPLSTSSSTVPPAPSLPSGAPPAPPLPSSDAPAPESSPPPPPVEDPYPLVFDRRYKTYYTMMKVKIPVQAIRMKAMGAEEDLDEFDEFIKQVQKKFPSGTLPAHPLDGEDTGGGGDDDSEEENGSDEDDDM